MPWMSRLLGPLSETIRRVSERASALAADQIAGADTIDPAATPVTDLRKSRRFMTGLQRTRIGSGVTSQGSCQILCSAERRVNALSCLRMSVLRALAYAGALHTKRLLCLLKMQNSELFCCSRGAQRLIRGCVEKSAMRRNKTGC